MKTQVKEVLNSKRSKKEKLSYLVEYYGKTSLVILGVLIFSGMLIWQMTQPKDTSTMTVAVVGTAEEVNPLRKVIAENEPLKNIFTQEDKRQVLTVTDEDTVMRQKYVVQIAAGEMDLVLMSKSEYELTAKQGGLLDLSEKIPELKGQDEFKEKEGLSLKAWLKTEETVPDFYFVIPKNAPHIDETIKLLENK